MHPLFCTSLIQCPHRFHSLFKKFCQFLVIFVYFITIRNSTKIWQRNYITHTLSKVCFFLDLENHLFNKNSFGYCLQNSREWDEKENAILKMHCFWRFISPLHNTFSKNYTTVIFFHLPRTVRHIFSVKHVGSNHRVFFSSTLKNTLFTVS